MKSRIVFGTLLATTVAVLVLLNTATGAGIDSQTQQAPTPTPSAQPFLQPTDPDLVLPAIVGGEEAPEDAYPWVAAIIRSSATSEKDGWSCGGSLIRPNWVLTAAHCADDNFYRPLPPSAIDVLIGRHRLSDSDGERIDVVEVIQHPNYNGATYDYDLALLRLSRDSSYPPIELVPAGDIQFSAPGLLSTIVGWGDTLENGPGSYSDVLRQVQLPIVANEVCNAPNSYNGKVTSRMLCAGLTDGGKDACQGDSGGPLMVSDSQGGWLQAGITSWGIGCAKPELYGVYTRIGVFAEWIQSQIDTASPTTTPTSTPSTTPTPSTATPQPTPQPTPSATPNYARKEISAVRTSNVRDSVFSVSWTTETPTGAAIYVATNPADLTKSPLIFTSSGIGQAHHVMATGLTAQTTYYFYLRSGDHVDDNRGSYYRVTTGRTLVLPNTDNVRGIVEGQNGKPVANCTVLAEIVDQDPAGSKGISAPLSTRSDAGGFWTLDLGNARTESLDAYFLYSLSGDRLSLEAQCAPGLSAGVTVDTNNDAPAPKLVVVPLQRVARVLNTGWNLVALPVQPVGRYTAERLCAEMKQSAATGVPVEVVRWRNNQWSGYICGVNANNFVLEIDVAYFVRHSGPGVLDLAGLPLTPAASKNSSLGWNGVNGARWNAANAFSLCESITQPQEAVEVNRWFAAGWDGHICKEGFNNFAVVAGDGYFVKTQSAPTASAAVETAQIPRRLPSLPQATGAVRDVVVANLTDGGAVFAWWTDAPAQSWVEISRNGQIVTAVYDVRGAQTTDHLHYVQVTGLTPETTYQFVLFSSYTDDRFGSQAGTFTTLKTTPVVPQSFSAYGRVFQEPGRAPSATLLAQLKLIDADEDGSIDQSLPLLALITDDGYWYVNLGNARTHSGDIYTFGADDIVEIVVKAHSTPPVTQRLAVAESFPAAAIEMPKHILYIPSAMFHPKAEQ